jgi:hypothetical protein
VTSAKTELAAHAEPMRLNLPLKIDINNCGSFHSDPGIISTNIELVSESIESELLAELIMELNAKFLTDLADLSKCQPYSSNDSDWASFFEGKKVIVMGGSHAGWLPGCLDDLKLQMADLSTPGWKITEEAVDTLIV